MAISGIGKTVSYQFLQIQIFVWNSSQQERKAWAWLLAKYCFNPLAYTNGCEPF
jgi:hypothetical protein